MAPEPDADGSDDENRSKSTIEKLIDFLIDLYFGSVLNAVQLCTIMWYLALLGFEEYAGKYKMNPDSQSGKFQDKLNDAFGFRKEDKALYEMNLVVRNARTNRREVEKVHAVPAHESLKREIDENPGLLESWEDCMEEGAEWISSYMKHPAVAEASADERKRILPGALYMDGAAFQNRDSLFVFTIRFCFSKRRHLVWTLRKSNLCNCGCAGWCSFFQLFQFIAWSLNSLLDGCFPSRRHDGAPLDPDRASLGGMPLGFKLVICDILGDWKEFANSWGFPSWSSLLPCFMCSISKAAMANPRSPIVPRPDSEYEDQCRLCEIWVPITTRQQHEEIKYKLVDDSTRKGLALKEPVLSTAPHLAKGDRLEPSPEFSDVYEIFGAITLPCLLLFWRIRPGSIVVHHRNPVLSIRLGISYSTFSIDVLHCFHLGIYQVYITRVLHLLFAKDALETRASRKGDHLMVCAIELKSKLHQWYPRYEASLDEDAKKGVSRINVFTEKMLGTADQKKTVKLKAAETRHFLPFVVELVKEHRELLRDSCDVESLVRAGETLMEFMDVINQEPRKMSEAGSSRLLELILEHNECAFKAGVHMLPKHHQAHPILL